MNAYSQEHIKNIGMQHIQAKVLVIDERDRMIWDLITEMPQVNLGVAVAGLVLNVILPGSGTWLCTCVDKQNVSKA